MRLFRIISLFFVHIFSSRFGLLTRIHKSSLAILGVVYHKNNCSGLCFELCFNHFGKLLKYQKVAFLTISTKTISWHIHFRIFFFFEIHLSGAIIASSHLFLLSSVVGRWIFLFNYDKIHFKSAKEVWKTKTTYLTNKPEFSCLSFEEGANIKPTMPSNCTSLFMSFIAWFVKKEKWGFSTILSNRSACCQCLPERFFLKAGLIKFFPLGKYDFARLSLLKNLL